MRDIAKTPAILVTSGKGGTGKTLISANLALKLSEINKRVGLIDCDLRAPNLTYIMNVYDKKLEVDQNRLIVPFKINENLEIFSTEHYFARDNHRHRAIILPGETVRSMVYQSVYGVHWHDPEIFVMDSDPSTSDVLIELTRIFKNYLNAVVVTTNDISSIFDCERTIDALKIENIKILGIIGNMIWNGEDYRIRDLSASLGIPYLGYIPYNNIIRLNNNQGIAEIPSNIIDFRNIVEQILNKL
ncbi:MAG: P-loop NTPase [Thermoplasmata archaeon]